jgi:hypothetical protein
MVIFVSYIHTNFGTPLKYINQIILKNVGREEE